ncbi:MAG: 50S ribosomal protein L25 [Proteobacteria bacterium]|nr:50S ribosomal protein L25 [Pseudomonadota bacterium]
MSYEMIATARSAFGTGASRRLRRAGRVPAIVYGGKEDPLSIEIDHNTVFHQIKHKEFFESPLTLVLDNTKHSVMVQNIQMHPFRPLVLHVDFKRV